MSDEDLVNLEQFKHPKSTPDPSESSSNSGYEIAERTTEMTERAFSVSGVPLVQMTEDIEENIRQRGKAYRALKNSQNSKDDDSDDFTNAHTMERSQSLYCRSSDGETVNLEDFQLVSILGKGSFGKVPPY